MVWMMLRLVMRSRRGPWGGGPWGRGPWGGTRGRGPYGGWPGSGGPQGGQNGGQGAGGGPTWTGGQGSGNTPSAPTWTGGQSGADGAAGSSTWPSRDAPASAAPSGWSVPGVPAGGGGWDEWMSDQRPAAASIPVGLFPVSPARTAQVESPVDVGLAAIKAHDPTFDVEQFTGQVRRVFFLVQQAWAERAPEVARQVMTDDLWLTQRAQIESYVESHKRRMLDYLSVSSILPVAAGSDTRFDTVTVRIVAASTDYDVDDTNGRILRGDAQVKPWEENWTFRRPSGASGTYDWVLAGISQVSR